MTALLLVERIERARDLLSGCLTLDQWKVGADQAAAVLEFCKRHEAATLVHADAWELVQIANRGLGEMCKALPQARRGRKPESEIVFPEESISKGAELERLNITPKRAHVLEALAAIAEDEWRAQVEANRARIVEGERPKPMGAASSASDYDSDKWHTPNVVLEAARRLLGGPIDLDPASNAEANRAVQAKKFYTAQDSGLEHLWRAERVWLNPPYSDPLCGQFTHKMLLEHMAKRSKRAVVLVNNATDTKWFHELLDAQFPVLLTKGRLAFERDGKPIKGNDHGQALFGLGVTTRAFKREFAQFGKVMVAA